MKKMTALLIAISFCTLSAGSALAKDSPTNTVDRYAVWTNWFDESGKRIPNPLEDKDSESGVHAETTKSNDKNSKNKSFDFIKETKSYDYNKDKDKSS